MGFLQKVCSDDNMALWIISNKETLSLVLRRFKKVYQNFERCVQREDPKVSETGLTLSVSILVTSRNVPILLVQNYHRNYNPRTTCFGQAPIMLARISHSSKSLEAFL